MYCTYCKMARVENEAPCPNCGAPSPLFGQSRYAAGAGAAGNPAGTAFGEQWDRQNYPPAWQPPVQEYNPNPMPSWQQPAQAYNYNPMPSWQQSAEVPLQGSEWQQSGSNPRMQGFSGQGAQSGTQSGTQSGPPSLLPVPYQPGMALQSSERQSTISLQLVPDHAVQHLLTPQQSLSETVYVPPMYVKPRPIVPKYRIISGLLSVIIMALVVCAGAGYYAQTQGVLAKATQFITGTPPKSLPLTSSTNIPDPPEQIAKDLGPAYNAIPSAVTTLNIDKNNLARQPAKIFKRGEIFYLVFSVQAPADGRGGKVHTKWYTNDKFFTEITSQEQIKPGDIKSGNIQMRFTAPLSGRIELFWNDQFAQRLYFAVK
ncbi:MAG: hypothetical protein PVS3B1_09600 [Ktedonobacteraceae bacterium]